ncbi:MAG: winged helix-turn-helix domain-containing protein [archaeon]|nr:winged helix-turn-helix domain-containing protein [archaeon]
MAKRDKLEIIKDILRIIKENHGHIKMTPLLRKSNLSSRRFADYKSELIERSLISEVEDKKKGREILITEKGMEFLEKYRAIVNFINEFDL